MNRFQKQKNSFSTLRNLLISFAIFLAILILFFQGIRSVSASTAEEEKKSLQNAIMRSAVHCYAVEGAYPESLSYLEDHYGITYDHSRFVIDYEIIGSNLKPSVTIITWNNSREDTK